ncbi:hypothetical protein M514_06942 [Trichuris suis]|uniref:Uncharacterized protein n=1 Tax=Trichuris suis TaxID=68888 RepID=A0A085M4T3_9BILA|nr:hypothetical protein M513_06942 [Trichuris suis]KFD70323.1 hypothetical protein M514_06942 [Trichuris suis]
MLRIAVLELVPARSHTSRHLCRDALFVAENLFNRDQRRFSSHDGTSPEGFLSLRYVSIGLQPYVLPIATKRMHVNPSRRIASRRFITEGNSKDVVDSMNTGKADPIRGGQLSPVYRFLRRQIDGNSRCAALCLSQRTAEPRRHGSQSVHALSAHVEPLRASNSPIRVNKANKSPTGARQSLMPNDGTESIVAHGTCSQR